MSLALLPHARNRMEPTVQRVLAQAKLKPHGLERYMASNDPQCEEQAADIIGLYLNPPQHAAVFCVDEKSAIQALDRLDPVLLLSPGRAERHGIVVRVLGSSHSNPMFVLVESPFALRVAVLSGLWLQ